VFASVTVETREWIVTMEICINTACDHFCVKSDMEEIWEGGYIITRAAIWLEMGSMRRLGNAKTS
jgi:hypothetical protein